MARILYGPLVTAVKGSIGGVTFQGNPSGSIIRSRPHLSKVSTNKQTAKHATFAGLLFQWQNITQDERDEWNAFASAHEKVNKFGEIKYLTGINWFTSVNYMLSKMASPAASAPPSYELPANLPQFEIQKTDSSLKILFIDAFDYGTSSLIIWASLPTRINTLSINQVRKWLSIENWFSTNPLDITAYWEQATGLSWNPAVNFPTANIFVCLEAVNKNSGITGPLSCAKNSTHIVTPDTIYYY